MRIHRQLDLLVPALAAALLLLPAARSHAQEPPAAEAAPAADARSAPPDTRVAPPVSAQLDLFVWSTSPVALDAGMVLGGGVDARRPFGSGNLFYGVRLAGGSTTEYTADWELRHLHGLATLDGGWERRFGAGSVRAQLGLGGLFIGQLGQRHQYERLEAAGLGELRRDGWSLGPYASLELGAAVALYDSWRLFVQLGPAFTVQQVSGERAGSWLFSSGLGVGRAF